MKNEVGHSLDKKELKDARRRSSPKAAIVYEAIRSEGEDELGRSAAALVWSGLAAGLSMGFSFLMEALLGLHLPEADWTPLVSKFGYCIGFIIVILGRQQLFTENTLTPVLQLLHRKNRHTLGRVAQLWGIVLLANLAGAAIFALLMGAMSHYQVGLRQELTQIGMKVVGSTFPATLLSALFAGWMIALMVWLLPVAESGRVSIIILVTYVVGLGGFSHIIAGSVSAFYVMIAGASSMVELVGHFFIPTLIGNIVGGVAFVAAINYAQVNPPGDEEKVNTPV
jgi:formate/nitrite transporter FocA (FNT family)